MSCVTWKKNPSSSFYFERKRTRSLEMQIEGEAGFPPWLGPMKIWQFCITNVTSKIVLQKHCISYLFLFFSFFFLHHIPSINAQHSLSNDDCNISLIPANTPTHLDYQMFHGRHWEVIGCISSITLLIKPLDRKSWRATGYLGGEWDVVSPSRSSSLHLSLPASPSPTISLPPSWPPSTSASLPLNPGPSASSSISSTASPSPSVSGPVSFCLQHLVRESGYSSALSLSVIDFP